MITPADDFDDGTHGAPDDPLAVILRPAAAHLAPPPGRYEDIRRGAARRRLLRTAAGVGVTCAVAAAVVLPLRLSASEAPASPAVPLAPPPMSSPFSGSPTPPASPTPTEESPTAAAASTGAGPTEGAPTPGPDRRTGTGAPAADSTRPSPSAEDSRASIAPSAQPSAATDARETREGRDSRG
ncbi:hypothetical protein [Streptomyces sp. NPDC088254]|uniref:hypothetical protein n=1 Tax=Streptomyces sp. NPDC088254 TaxID=3365847 RepID=UPI00381A890C